MNDRVEVDVEFTSADRKLIDEILNRAESSIISWRELVELGRARGFLSKS